MRARALPSSAAARAAGGAASASTVASRIGPRIAGTLTRPDPFGNGRPGMVGGGACGEKCAKDGGPHDAASSRHGAPRPARAAGRPDAGRRAPRRRGERATRATLPTHRCGPRVRRLRRGRSRRPDRRVRVGRVCAVARPRRRLGAPRRRPRPRRAARSTARRLGRIRGGPRPQARLPPARRLGRRGGRRSPCRAPRPRLPERRAPRHRPGGRGMSTVASGEPERPVVAERLRALLARRAHGVDPAALAIFARLLLARAAGYADALGDDDTAAFVAGAFRFFAAPGPELRVRAFTPTYASEGWDAPYSVIETAMPDRPFTVDTIRARLDARGVAIHAFLHPILAVRRDETGGAEEIGQPDAGLRRASFAHVAIARTSDADLARLVDEIRSALEDVRVVTDDFPPMLARVHAVAGELDAVARTGTGRADGGPVASFLRWLADGGFVFLGYREYGLTTVDGRTALRVRPGSGLGLLRREERSGFRDGYAVDTLPPWARARLSGERLLTVAK